MSDTPNSKNDLLALLHNTLNYGKKIKIKSDGKKVRLSLPAEQFISTPVVNELAEAEAEAESESESDLALGLRVPPRFPIPFPDGDCPPQAFPQPGRFPQQSFPQPGPFPRPDGRFPQQPFPQPGRFPQPLPPQRPQPIPLPGPNGRIPNPLPPQSQPNPPLPNPRPGKSGPSDVNIMIQDPTTAITVDGKQSSILKIQLPEGLPANLQGSDIVIDPAYMATMPPIVPDADNNILLDPIKNPKQFEAVSIYSIVKMAKNMVERVLKKKLVSSWGNQPITIVLNDQEEANAFFGQTKRVLIFRFFRDVTTGKTVYTSLMFDVATHEAGHWILDCLQPNWISSNFPETRAIHEAFGDMTTLLALLDNRDVCSALAQATGGDLHKRSFFSDFSEQFGMALLKKNNGLRNADDNVKMGEVTNQEHDLSRVLVGAVYDIIAEMANESRKTQPAEKLPEVLYEVGEQIKFMVLQAVVNCPQRDPSFSDFIKGMANAAPTSAIKSMVERIAAEKLISVASKKPAPQPAPFPGSQFPQPLPFPRMPRQAYLPLRAVVDQEGKPEEADVAAAEEEVFECVESLCSRSKRKQVGI